MDAYVYIKDKAVDNKIYWKCEMYKKCKSSTRVITVDDSIKKQSGNHNHVGDAAGIDGAKAMEKVKERPINSRDTAQYIVPRASMEVNGAAVVKLPLIDNGKRTMCITLTRKNVGLAQPNTYLDLNP